MVKTPAVTLAVVIPVDSFPTSGHPVTVSISDELVAEVRRVGKGTKLPASPDRIPNTLRYAAVHTALPAGEEVHAAITRRVGNRNTQDRFTLCDRKGLRVVNGLRHQPLEVVTCKQCRNQLIEDGVLDPDSGD